MGPTIKSSLLTKDSIFPRHIVTERESYCRPLVRNDKGVIRKGRGINLQTKTRPEICNQRLVLEFHIGHVGEES